MSYCPPDKSLAEEIAKLAANLKIEDFAPASPGFGFGRLVPSFPGKKIVSLNEKINAAPHKLIKETQKENSLQKISAVSPLPYFLIKKSLLRKILIHITDLIVVISTMIVMLIFVGIFLNIDHPKFDIGSILNWLPFKIAIRIGIWKTLLVVYGTYFVYRLSFKIFNAGTIGNSWNSLVTRSLEVRQDRQHR
ncbi:MAG: hypothetical protein HQK54_11335 [Oligoflexales bacterium]|nr:hypothetical protein [Oligoflexales bacterium]